MLGFGFVGKDSGNKDTSFSPAEAHYFADKTTQAKKMSSRALRPQNPNLSSTLLPPSDDGRIKAKPQGLRVTKTRSSNCITKGHSVPSQSTKPHNSPQFNVKNLSNVP